MMVKINKTIEIKNFDKYVLAILQSFPSRINSKHETEHHET